VSLNAALNATVALIEGRTDLARNILRSPVSDVKNVPEILARLDRAVRRVAAKAIRNAMIHTLAVRLGPKPDDRSDYDWKVYEEGFYEGVTAAEKVIEDIASSMEDREAD